MADAGEGLIDAQARIQERMDEREEERVRRAHSALASQNPERWRRGESSWPARWRSWLASSQNSVCSPTLAPDLQPPHDDRKSTVTPTCVVRRRARPVASSLRCAGSSPAARNGAAMARAISTS